MNIRTNHAAMGIAALRRLGHVPAPPAATKETCELCGAAIAAAHRHLLEMPARRIVCACDACAMCFQGVVGGRHRLIPRDARTLPDFTIADGQWRDLALPIDLAFFFFDSERARTVALYPGPAGAVESALDLEAWDEIAAAHPALSAMQPDVEALIANRTGRAPPRYLIAPIDACFRLTGIIRVHWRGFSGGADVWREVAKFFAELERSAGRGAPATAEAAHA